MPNQRIISEVKCLVDLYKQTGINLPVWTYAPAIKGIRELQNFTISKIDLDSGECVATSKENGTGRYQTNYLPLQSIILCFSSTSSIKPEDLKTKATPYFENKECLVQLSGYTQADSIISVGNPLSKLVHQLKEVIGNRTIAIINYNFLDIVNECYNNNNGMTFIFENEDDATMGRLFLLDYVQVENLKCDVSI